MMFDRRRELGHLPAFFLRTSSKKKKEIVTSRVGIGLILMTAGGDIVRAAT
jgi:hypothetical protein